MVLWPFQVAHLHYFLWHLKLICLLKSKSELNAEFWIQTCTIALVSCFIHYNVVHWLVDYHMKVSAKNCLYQPVDCLTTSLKLRADELPGQRLHRASPCQHNSIFWWQWVGPDHSLHPPVQRYVHQWRNVWCNQSARVLYCSEGVCLRTAGYRLPNTYTRKQKP